VVEQGTNLKRPNIPVYLYQKDRKGVQVLIDSAITNSEGVYNFSCGRPNRNYVVYVHEPRVENVAPRMIALDVLVPPSTNPLDLPLVTISQGKGKPPVFAKAPSTLVDSNYLKYGRLGIDTSWLVKHDPHAHQKVVLDSVYFIIYFDFDKYALKQESVNTLNRATNYLKSNPNNGFILLGHTDLRGNPTYNINLSRNRVSAAKKYMTSKGIEPRRLELEYFGQKFPVKRALTPEAGKLNRRVEFILIKK
jgi:outer membrane protein OmpA-like peptidoglycan-associated protein